MDRAQTYTVSNEDVWDFGFDSPHDKRDSGNCDSTAIETVLEWLDTLELTRIKGSGRYHRDFADGRLIAEVLAIHYPKYVDLHNYQAANALEAKRSNWELLRRKVFDKIRIPVSNDLIDKIIFSRQGAIEQVLSAVYDRVMEMENERIMAYEKEQAEKAERQAKIRASRAALTSNQWVDYSCVGRVNSDGREEIVVCGKLVIEKAKYDAMVQQKNDEISALHAQVKSVTAQLSRLQLLVELKEDHLMDLTKELSNVSLDAQKLRSDLKEKDKEYEERLMAFKKRTEKGGEGDRASTSGGQSQ